MATPVSGAEVWLTLNGVPLSFRPGDHNLDAGAKEYDNNFLKVTPSAPEQLRLSIDAQPLETEVYGRWLWRPAGFAGLYRLRAEAPGQRSRMAQVRVYPSKHSYARYQAMMSDISRIATDLLFQINSPASESLRPQQVDDRPAAIREFELVRRIVGEFQRVFPQIQRRPHRRLAIQQEQRLLHEVPYFSPEVQPVPGAVLSRPGDTSTAAWVPELWMAGCAEPSYDVYENRLLKHFLWRQLLPRIDGIQARAGREMRRREQGRTLKLSRGWEDDETSLIDALKKVTAACSLMRRLCIAWCSAVFLSSVGRLNVPSVPSQVLQKHPHYNQFYQLYLRFQQELRFSFNPDLYLHRISLRKLSELYEIWSVFRMTEVLLSIFQKAGYKAVSANGFYTLRDDQFHLDVDPGAGIELFGRDRRIVVRYEPAYPTDRSVAMGIVSTRSRYPLTPDLSVEVWSGQEAKALLIFDAKYRWEEDNGDHICLQEDLEKMDYYYRNIRWKTPNPRQRPLQVVSSAYVLYPGNALEHDPQYPETGALPLVPNLDRPKETLHAILKILKNANLL